MLRSALALGLALADGTTLAWSDSVGVWTARFAVPAQTGQACVVTAKRLLARRATSPDWGPSGA